MEIFVISDCEKKEVKVNVNPEDTVVSLQYKLSEIFNIPVNCQALVMNGQLIDDSKNLKESGVQNGAKIEVINFVFEIKL
ncbi:hypothetical protein BpHYR1_002101 [Brachionus plicatilis]|uniref:Ubiquitin-like domain-containing protein n=1 Tax=Brachionus plicatilis TaxID=10195 RepID=A0A3M7T972_BRAPC|nr:hypothetical protein BpHYR1_002101 [Brachionus plicatilis]